MKLYWLSLITLGLLSIPPVQADDTEIYVSHTSDAAPNVVFIMDTSGSMDSNVKDSSGKSQGTRLEVVRQAAVEVINNTTNINIALMRFNRTNSQGGWFSTPMMGIDDDNTRSIVKEVLYSYTAAGATPITESLYEAGSYLRGDPIKYGKTTTENSDICVTSVETTIPVVIPGTGATYPWWWEVVKYDWWMMQNTFSSSKMTWVSYKSLSKSLRKSFQKYYGITSSNYGKGDVPWWFALDSWRHAYIRNYDTGAYTNWSDLPSWFQDQLTRYYGITKTVYNNNIANDTTGPSAGTADTIEYQTVSTCTEYLNLDSMHDGHGNYISPITDECQTNHIVMFTDGDPNSDTDINSTVQKMVKTLPSSTYPKATNFSTSCSGEGGCAEELAWYYYHADNSSTLSGDQPIYIHTIGGFISGSAQTRLDAMASYGGGVSGNGSDADTLTTALTKVFENISSTTGTFSAPAVAVNAFNSLEHLDQLYYSVFRPATTVRWAGNVKRYRISGSDILDMKGNQAVDDTTGFFGDNAKSFWTLSEDDPDGSVVRKGGIARRLTAPANRHISTWLGGTTSLMNSANAISTSNTALQDQDLFDTSLTTEEFTKMLQWAAGYDTISSTSDTARREMEDPLHSRPVLLTYGYTTDSNGEKIPDSVMYVGSNSGYLHAFNTNIDSPYEHFAWVPQELLPNLAAYYQGTTTKAYGLDGQITAWHQDNNGDSIINNGEKAYIYTGMRRGGRNYYALDVSDRNNPKYLWQIDGGSGGFAELGQTWSKMQLTTVKWGGVDKEVLLFAGGYDEDEDNNDVRTAASMGNAIYMVDPTTGALLWKASPNSDANLRLTGMTSAIASNLSPVDMDGDGTVDLIYAADMGGRIWRIDFTGAATGASAGGYAQGGVIADLGTNGSTSENVRFFTSPDVTWNKTGYFYDSSAKKLYQQDRFQIAIGSGYRAHPLKTDTTDRLYIINDFYTSSAPTSYTKLTRSDLANYDSYRSATASQVKNGFYYTLPSSGEKSLSDSITINGYTYFTSYRPSNGESRSGCEPDIGYARVYVFSPQYYDYTDDVTSKIPTPEPPKEKIEVLTQPGIPPTPVIIVNTNGCEGGATVVVGAETLCPEEGGNTLYRNYWREN
jgi:type IV pilus assembly protein PilY1